MGYQLNLILRESPPEPPFVSQKKESYLKVNRKKLLTGSMGLFRPMISNTIRVMIIL